MCLSSFACQTIVSQWKTLQCHYRLCWTYQTLVLPSSYYKGNNYVPNYLIYCITNIFLFTDCSLYTLLVHRLFSLHFSSYSHIHFLTTLSISKTTERRHSPFLIAIFNTLLFLDINTIVFIIISSFLSTKSSPSVPFPFVCKLLDFVSPTSNILHHLLHFHIAILAAILCSQHTL